MSRGKRISEKLFFEARRKSSGICCPTLVFFVVQAADVSEVETSISACSCSVDGIGRTCTTRRCLRVASGTQLRVETLLGSALRVSD